MTKRSTFRQYFFVLALAISSTAAGADWGDLTAKFVLDGAVPTAVPIVPNKDPEVCGKHKLVDEWLVVNEQTKGIANVVVMLYLAKGDKVPPIHDSYKEAEKGSVRLDNENCRFTPHVVALRTTQTLVVGNKDAVGHNTNIATLSNPGQNILIPANADLKLTFGTPERVPAAPVSCNIHPWMKAHVVIKEHPYVGVSDQDGNVTIKNLPAGSFTFQIWQESSGFVQEASQNGKPVKWKLGRVTMDIKAGENKLGEIKLAPSIFKK